MGLEEFVEKYRAVFSDGHFLFPAIKDSERADVIAYVKKHKDELIGYLGMTPKRKKTLKEMRAGIEIVRKAIAEQERRRMNYLDKVEWGEKPPALYRTGEKLLSELREEYPRESAFIAARRLSESPHTGKKVAGLRAMRRLLDGDDVGVIMADMNSEWRRSLVSSSYIPPAGSGSYNLALGNSGGASSFASFM